LHQSLEKTVQGQTPEKIFITGRDLWRSHEAIRKVVTQKRLAQIASELTEQKPVRLGFDELFSDPGSIKMQDSYHQLLEKKMKLSDITSLQGTICGLMLCLQGSGVQPCEVPTAFSTTAGNGIFLSPDFVIDFQELYERQGYLYILIVYCQSSTVYIHQSLDPHAHALKALGYTYGDKLKDKLNPILIR
jgi:hypothetical protein